MWDQEGQGLGTGQGMGPGSSTQSHAQEAMVRVGLTWPRARTPEVPSGRGHGQLAQWVSAGQGKARLLSNVSTGHRTSARPRKRHNRHQEPTRKPRSHKESGQQGGQVQDDRVWFMFKLLSS